MSVDAIIATNRFGLGATPGLITQVARNPKDWLKNQLNDHRAARIDGPELFSTPQAFEAFLAYTRERQQQRNVANQAAQLAQPQAAMIFNRGARAMANEVESRVVHALITPAPFLERWALFWANALTVSAKNLQTLYVAGPYEREAIRPHVLGRFTDLLMASALHPGMLIYLDQARSVGPNAPAAINAQRRARNIGLNENLAREILELHTLGVDGGYTQADVTEFARALTGWTIAGPMNRLGRAMNGASAVQGQTVFAANLHEPGPRTIMGRTFAQSGREQALAILAFLANQPQTARNIATKIAQHFVSDNPSRTLVTRLERNFQDTGGDLKALAITLIDSPEAWAMPATKFKSPNDFIISTMRASGATRADAGALRDTYQQLGQIPFRAPSPKGWPDSAQEWGSPDAILKRVDWSNLAARVIAPITPPMAFAENALALP
ncbi:MAG: DUF1800 domain-containing protein [Hyphomonadaceae bacterium]|nr:DUF1800 domain-containing protein [Hyphomonadaceae bacterium]